MLEAWPGVADRRVRGAANRGAVHVGVTVVVPHGHYDHANPDATRELRALGYSIRSIVYHAADKELLTFLRYAERYPRIRQAELLELAR